MFRRSPQASSRNFLPHIFSKVLDFFSPLEKLHLLPFLLPTSVEKVFMQLGLYNKQTLNFLAANIPLMEKSHLKF